MKSFENYAEFINYVEELKSWLFDHDYVEWYRPNMLNSSSICRKPIMRDEQAWFEDLKQKNIYNEYLEFYNNTKNYLENHIIVQKRNYNERFMNISTTFMFESQHPNYDDFYQSFVWTLWENRNDNQYSYIQIPEILFTMPHNDKYYQFGACWYSKQNYSIDDIISGKALEYTTEQNIEKFIKKVLKLNGIKNGQQLSFIEYLDERSKSCCPGPVTHCKTGISGFKISLFNDYYEIFGGVESKIRKEVNLLYTETIYKNKKTKRIRSQLKNDMIRKLIIEYLGLDPNEIKSIVWLNHKIETKTRIINNDGNIIIYSFNPDLYNEFGQISTSKRIVSSACYNPVHP